MATASAAKSKNKARAAKAEKEKGPKSVEWRGHTFTLPDEFPKSLVFRLAEIEEAGADTRPTLRLLRSLLNAGERDQYPIVIAEIENADDEDEVVGEAFELLGQISASYGTSEGESAAS